jgi:hypothetical protein
MKGQSRREFLTTCIRSTALAALGGQRLAGATAPGRSAVSLSDASGSQLRPAPADEFLGVQTHFGQFRSGSEGIFDLIRRAGISWVRDEIYWEKIENRKGVFDFPPAYDDYVKIARKQNLRLLLILDFGNPLYMAGGKIGPATDEERAAFGRYCGAAVRRYKSMGVRHYEIWNEPNASTFWQPKPNPKDYAKLLETAYQACKEADPGCTVLGCSTSGTDLAFIEQVFASGGEKFMDAVSFHPYDYPKAPETYILQGIAALRKIVGEKPLWITEIGYPTHVGSSGVSEEQQANLLVRTVLLARSAPTVRRLFWYDFQNDGTDPADNESNFGLIRKDQTAKLAYAAVRTMSSLLMERPFVELRNDGVLYQCKFGDGADEVIALWTLGEPVQADIPVTGKRFRIIERDGEAQTVEARDSSLKIVASGKVRYVVPAD